MAEVVVRAISDAFAVGTALRDRDDVHAACQAARILADCDRQDLYRIVREQQRIIDWLLIAVAAHQGSSPAELWRLLAEDVAEQIAERS